jgi:hypothetical protein
MAPESVTSHQPSYDAFLSHSRRDAKIVAALATWIEREARLAVWLEQWVLVAGEQWMPEMAGGVQHAYACAVCLGSEGLSVECQNKDGEPELLLDTRGLREANGDSSSPFRLLATEASPVTSLLSPKRQPLPF